MRPTPLILMLCAAVFLVLTVAASDAGAPAPGPSAQAPQAQAVAASGSLSGAVSGACSVRMKVSPVTYGPKGRATGVKAPSEARPAPAETPAPSGDAALQAPSDHAAAPAAPLLRTQDPSRPYLNSGSGPVASRGCARRLMTLAQRDILSLAAARCLAA